MIEELLKLLVGIVNRQLLECVCFLEEQISTYFDTHE